MKTRWEGFYCLHNDNMINSFCKMVDFVDKCWITAVSVVETFLWLPYFQAIAQRSPFFPNCQIKIKIAKHSSVLIFKIWKKLFLYFSCKLSFIFLANFLQWNFNLILLKKTKETLKLLTLFLLYSIVAKNCFLNLFKNLDVNWYLFWDLVTFWKK